MRNIGICPYKGIVYEGTITSGTRLAIQPILLPIEFPELTTERNSKSSKEDRFAKMLFREDSFDPITRIRRGRVYNAMDYSQPTEWHINDPLRFDLRKVKVGNELLQVAGLQTYQVDPLNYFRTDSTPRVAVLGKEIFSTVWKVLGVESLALGDPMLTLKSFRFLGEVPKLIDLIIPKDSLSQLKEYLEKVENSANRLGANETVDRCRDALSIVFGTLIEDRKKDLADAISHYVKNRNGGKPNLVSYCGQAVARLHAKGKPNVQTEYGVSGLREEHAQLALRCLYVVLTELGWASKDD